MYFTLMCLSAKSSHSEALSVCDEDVLLFFPATSCVLFSQELWTQLTSLPYLSVTN